MEREANGRWVKGQSANPKGRPSKARETRFLEITQQTVTFEDWRQIVEKAKDQAKRGDAVARKWLGDYLQGAPVQRQEVTGADGRDITVALKWVDGQDDGYSPEPG